VIREILRTVAGASAWALVLACAPPAGLPAQASPLTAELLYVCIQDEAKIAVVDMQTREVLRTIDLRALGFSETAKPHYIVVDPDGASWYVSLIGENRVVKFDASDRIVGHYETEVPGMLALTPAGDRLVASRSMSAVSPPSRVAVIDTETMRGEEVGVLFPRPHPMAVAPNGFAYTGSLGVNQLASIELSSERVEVVAIPGPDHSLVQFRVSPDGRTLVGTGDRSGQLLVFDLATPAKPAFVTAVELGPMAFDPVFTPDGRFVYVPLKGTNEVVVVETGGWTLVRRITHAAFQQPHQIVFSADGRTAFVTNNNKADHMADPAMAGHEMHAAPGAGGGAALVILDVASGEVTGVLELGANLTGMGTRSASR
jgi:DNA-binding beta-propeller fold protein YncE